jgi:hypothetical protein
VVVLESLRRAGGIFAEPAKLARVVGKSTSRLHRELSLMAAITGVAPVIGGSLQMTAPLGENET